MQPSPRSPPPTSDRLTPRSYVKRLDPNRGSGTGRHSTRGTTPTAALLPGPTRRTRLARNLSPRSNNSGSSQFWPTAPSLTLSLATSAPPRPCSPSARAKPLPEWLDAVRQDDLPSLHTLAADIDRDRDAVTAGLTLPWSSGVVEGHVNRIKMPKRHMFGRAGFQLLRKRVLLA
ncbi:transposase [Streptomyces sp. NPDC005263]|uniref:transposase n=1 Tax=Streptomyces sp. NPDC005263 TaxID=3364711 RepID=UPI0036BB7906